MVGILSLAIFSAGIHPAHHYTYNAVFMEGCSCHDVCISEITGKDAGCHGMGAISFKKGSFDGVDTSGAKVAFVWDSDKWVRVYVDADSEAKRKAVVDFMKIMLDGWGTYEGASPAKIDVTNNAHEMSFTINGGSTGAMSVKPILGGDGKTGVAYDNLKSPMHSKLWQGETVNATFSDVHSFTLQGTNAYYNLACTMKGQI